MKKTIIVLLALCLVVFAFAQEKTYRHNIALDLGGPATIAQLEYQYNFIAKERHYIGVSASFGKFFGGNAIPIGFQYRWGKTFQLETGIHFTYLWSAVTSMVYISPRLGARLNLKKLFFHIYAAPMISTSGLGYQPWGGLGLGLNL